MDREEFYRLKKVSGKKQRDAAAGEKERENAQKAADEKDKKKEESVESKDLLGDQDNEDVIF